MRIARTSRFGFTLVELLVVIGIIALLIAILLPSLSRARSQANAVKCASQMRDIGNQLMIYATSNKGVIWPLKASGSYASGFKHRGGDEQPQERWPMFVFVPPPSPGPQNKYIHPMMICPIDQDPAGDHSYNINAVFAPTSGRGNTVSKIIRLGNKVRYYTPSEVVLMVDKWPQAPEWHLDVDWTDSAMTQWDASFCERQWDWLVFNVQNKATDVARYKHGKSGNNYLRFDFSVANEPPNEPRAVPPKGIGKGRFFRDMAAPHTYIKE